MTSRAQSGPARPGSARSSSAGRRRVDHRSAGRRRADHRSAGHRSAGHRGAEQSSAPRSSPLIGRLAACLLCCGLAVTAVRENYLFRGFEAWLASHVVALATSSPAGRIPQTPSFWFTVSAHHDMGLNITPECTVVLLMTPFLIASACLVWRRSSVLRTLAACAVAVLLLLIVNQIRILTIVLFVLKMGYNGGFYWGHTLVGSVITVLGGAATLVAYALIAIKQGKSEHAALSAG